MPEGGFLIDTHVLIWSLYQRAKLPERFFPALEGGKPTWISVATVWEVEIKKKTGKLPIPDAIWSQATDVGHRVLTIETRHAVTAARLPRHHGDPFDRMLIAQARIEGLTILTVDEAFRAYDVDVL